MLPNVPALPVRRPAPRGAVAGGPAVGLAPLALIGSAALWGTSFVAAKPVLDDVAPASLALLRLVVAAALIVPIARIRGSRPNLGPGPALLGLFGIALFFLFQNAGLRSAAAADAAIVLGSMPAVTVLLAGPLLGEHPDRRQSAGLAASIAGLVVVARAARSDAGAGSSDRGLLLLAGAAACGAAYALIGRQIFAGPGFLGSLAGSTIYGALFLVPPAAAEVLAHGAPLPGMGTWMLVLYMGGGCSALAFGLWAYGLRHLTASRSAIITNLKLPIGLVAADLVLGERLAADQVVGTALVLGGAVLAMTAPGIRRRSATG